MVLELAVVVECGHGLPSLARDACRDGAGWELEAEFYGPDSGVNDRFGHAVDVFEGHAGNEIVRRVAITAPGKSLAGMAEGSVYLLSLIHI